MLSDDVNIPDAVSVDVRIDDANIVRDMTVDVVRVSRYIFFA